MSFEFPTLDTIVQRIQNDLLAALPESNPFYDNSFIKANVTSYAGRFEEFYIQFQILFDALFLDSTSGEFVDRWGAIFEFTRLAATFATGSVNFEGTDGAVIPASTALQGGSDTTYLTDTIATITTTTFNSISGNISGDVVTLTINSHGLATGNTVTVSGAVDAAVNGSHVITSIDQDTIEYTDEDITTSGPISGLTVSNLGASTTVTAQTAGSDGNLPAGPQISLQSAIAGVDNQAYIQFGGITGGSDVETDDEYRNRVLTRLANPIAEFSSSSITEQVKVLKLNDQTTVVKPLTASPVAPSPAPGQVVVIIVIVDPNTDNIRQPTVTELDSIKASIDLIAPANIVPSATASTNIDVTGPVSLQSIDINIANLFPSTDSSKSAIEENLAAFFVDTVAVSQTGTNFVFTQSVRFNQVNSVVQESIDPESAQRPEDFDLTVDGGTSDIVIATHVRPILGTVTFS